MGLSNHEPNSGERLPRLKWLASILEGVKT